MYKAKYEFEKLCNLDEEIICGYKVSKKMKKVWNIELNMLKLVLDICKKHSLTIMMDAGSLLGTVRHHGFIPWDDDIDVIMPRPDYEKFLKIAKTEISSPFYLQSYYTEKQFFIDTTKIRCDDTAMASTEELLSYPNSHLGIFIDIFPFDLIPTDLNNRQKFINNQQLMILYMDGRGKKLFFNKQESNRYNEARSFMDKVKDYSDDQLFEYHHSYVTEGCVDSSIGTNLAVFKMPHETPYWDKSVFDDLTIAKFENLDVPIPSRYDEVLHAYYGDYLTPVKYPSVHGNLVKVILDPDKSFTFYQKKYYFLQYVVLIKNFISNYLFSIKTYVDSFKYYVHSKKLNSYVKKYSEQNIYLWGASNFLTTFLSELDNKKQKLPNCVKGVFDKSGCREGSSIYGLKIYSLKSIDKLDVDVVIVTIVNAQKERFAEILEYIKNKKIGKRIKFLLV